MPRSGRGGQRQGTQGTAYGNRTDLNLPISTVPNQGYGKASAQQAAQRSIPMGSSPVSTAPMESSNLSQPSTISQINNRVQNQSPGQFPVFEPTNKPNEPVTAGLPFGPGAGPESLQSPQVVLSKNLMDMALQSGSDEIAKMALGLNSIGL